MWQFQYKHGDRPLEGFTIQRAAGRGGFGEVYYAMSDGGREVALKAVTGYEQIELRGISQCMNLKNPHLVSIHDVKYNDQGRPFVIMEFVAGPNLRQILDESPGGLGAQKAAFFLREIGKGLTYLHDCGIVHRDLKPANIFYENGYVKIGDYGLSKAIAPTQHSGQTITVGTVHYMAPEIGGGRYDKSIDIYALGAVLHEMLTGQPPFLGGSAGEILMKHVATEPDLAGIEEPFRSVIKKAMAKNPADRYQSVQEMIESVFGSEHIQQSVSCFRPESLSMIADRVARRVAVGGGSATPPPIPNRGGGGGGATATAEKCWDNGDRVARAVNRFTERMGEVGNRYLGMGNATKVNAKSAGGSRTPGDPAKISGDPLCDPLSKKQRLLLSVIMMIIVSSSSAVFSPVDGSDGGFIAFWTVALCGFGAALGRTIAGRRILPQMSDEGPFLQRLASGGLSGAMMMILGILPMSSGGHRSEEVVKTAVGALIAMFLLPPPDLAASRPARVAVHHAILAALIGFICWIFTQGNIGLVIAIAAVSTLLAQLLSPWDPFAARRRMGLSSTGGAPSPIPTHPQRTHSKDSAMPLPLHPADAPTMAWVSIPPPIPSQAPTTKAERREAKKARRRQRRIERKARWNEARAWHVSGVPFTVRVARFFRGLFVGTSLFTLLLIATAATLYIAVDVPGILANGVFDPDTPRELTRHFGFSRWPQMLRGVGYVAAWVPMVLAAMVMIVSRRRTYGIHMMRGVLGMMVYGLALVMLVFSTARSSWLQQGDSQATATNRLSIDSRSAMVVHGDPSGNESELEFRPPSPDDRIAHGRRHEDDGERISAAIDRYIDRVNVGFLVASTGAALLALLMMCWPAARDTGGNGGGGSGKRAVSNEIPAAPAVA